MLGIAMTTMMAMTATTTMSSMSVNPVARRMLPSAGVGVGPHTGRRGPDIEEYLALPDWANRILVPDRALQ